MKYFDNAVNEVSKIFKIDKNVLKALSILFLKLKVKPTDNIFKIFLKQNKNVYKDYVKGGNTFYYLTVYFVASLIKNSKTVYDIQKKSGIDLNVFTSGIYPIIRTMQETEYIENFESAFNTGFESFFSSLEAQRVLQTAPNLFFKSALFFLDSTKTGKEAATEVKTVTREEFEKAKETLIKDKTEQTEIKKDGVFDNYSEGSQEELNEIIRKENEIKAKDKSKESVLKVIANPEKTKGLGNIIKTLLLIFLLYFVYKTFKGKK